MKSSPPDLGDSVMELARLRMQSVGLFGLRHRLAASQKSER